MKFPLQRVRFGDLCNETTMPHRVQGVEKGLFPNGTFIYFPSVRLLSLMCQKS